MLCGFRMPLYCYIMLIRSIEVNNELQLTILVVREFIRIIITKIQTIYVDFMKDLLLFL